MLARDGKRIWARGDSNPHTEVPDPKSGASANSATHAGFFERINVVSDLPEINRKNPKQILSPYHYALKKNLLKLSCHRYFSRYGLKPNVSLNIVDFLAILVIIVMENDTHAL